MSLENKALKLKEAKIKAAELTEKYESLVKKYWDKFEAMIGEKTKELKTETDNAKNLYFALEKQLLAELESSNTDVIDVEDQIRVSLKRLKEITIEDEEKLLNYLQEIGKYDDYTKTEIKIKKRELNKYVSDEVALGSIVEGIKMEDGKLPEKKSLVVTIRK